MPRGVRMVKVGWTTFSSSKYIKYIGVGRYEEALLPRLQKIGIEITPLYLNKKEYPIGRTGNRIAIYMKEQLLTGSPDGYDLIHASSQFSATKYTDIITVHDLIGLKIKAVPYIQRMLWKACIPFLKKAKHIISVSNTTKDDLVTLLGIDGSKITVVHNGVDTDKFYRDKDNNLKEKFYDKTTLLFVGEFRDYKNVSLLLKTMVYLNMMDAKRKYKLVLVSKPSPTSLKFWQDHKHFLKNNMPPLDIEWLQNVDDDMLRKLYSTVDLFVFPSLYEGFGLPPVEAMACGTNVVALDTPIHREILKDMAFFSKNDKVEFAKTIMHALENKKSSRELINFVKKNYNWNKNAKQIKEVYEKVK